MSLSLVFTGCGKSPAPGNGNPPPMKPGSVDAQAPTESDAAAMGTAFDLSSRDSAALDFAAAADDALAVCGRTIDVANQMQLVAAVDAAVAGDCILVANGQYSGVTVHAKGNANAPIVIKAVNRLGATFSSAIVLNAAEFVVLAGFSFNGTAPALTITDSKSCRLTRSKVQLGNGTWIVVDGSSDGTRIDHCDLGGAATTSDIVNPTGLSTNTLIDRNYFHDLSATHTITLGCCGATYDYHDTGDIAEHNLFQSCNSGAELFSIKSSASTVRYNTVRACDGDIDIRSGRHNLIYGNWVFNGTKGSGIRMYEDDHQVFNNYVESARTLQMGPSHMIHAQVKSATIVFNTFVGAVHFGDDLNTNFSNNIVLGTISNQAGDNGTMPITPTYQGNILFMGSGPANGFTVEDPRLVRMGEPLMISASSPAVGAAVGSFPMVPDDIEGKPRGAKPDIGAEQYSSAPALRPPLSVTDVGPDAP
jgi:hypothetical protein